jgi:hypothetical protein
MQVDANALPQPLGQSVVPSGRRNGGFDQREIRRDPYGPYDPAGIIVVASAWLAFYVATLIHLL